MGGTTSSDPRDRYSYNLTPEIALRLGKLIGSQYRDIVVGRDGNLSSRMIEKAFIAGALSTGGTIWTSCNTPAPALPFTDEKPDCYVSIDMFKPSSMSGVGIHNPDGSYFTENQMLSLTSKENTILYPSYSNIQDIKNTHSAVPNYIEKVTKNLIPFECQFVLSQTFQATSYVATEIIKRQGGDVIGIVRHNDLDFMPSLAESDLRDLTKTQKSFEGSIATMINSSGSAMAAFDENGKYIDPETILMVIAKFMNPKKVTVPLSMTMGIDEITDGISIMTRDNIKSISDTIVSNKSDLGADGHGRIIFPNVSYAPDGIMAAAMLGAVKSECKICDIIEELPKYVKQTELIRIYEDKDHVMRNIQHVAECTEYESMVIVDGIRLNHDAGWILIRPDRTDESAIQIMCESADKAYLIGLMEIAKSIVNEALRMVD